MSDHFPVCFEHKFRGVKSPKCDHDEISYRNLKKPNFDHFIQDLESAPWSLLEVFDDINDKLATWELIFHDVMNRHMPIVKKRVRRKCLSPWMNKEIMHLIHLRDQFKSRAKSNILARTMYKNLRNRVVKNIANAKAAHMSPIIIKSHISDATVFHIPPISTQQVIEDLKSIPNNKATDLDGIGIKPPKLALNAIAPSLTHIYNSSIASGTWEFLMLSTSILPTSKKPVSLFQTV